jgi:hypothetical protein
VSNELSFDAFEKEWLIDVQAGNPSTVELGNRFSRKLVTQWLEIGEDSGSPDDINYCDGTGDGGIDIACLQRGDESEDSNNGGDTWYLVQSKYGSAFSGTSTLLEEAQKLIDTLDGKRNKLSSLAEGLVEQGNRMKEKAGFP